MATDVTLTAAMRANLYSLQQTAQLMATTQQRLSTGKKVNSALDNPQNYFSALALTNRANDISSLLDGMGQAIQAITTASNGITAAQSVVSQMKSVATSASQSITTASSANVTNVAANGAQGTAGATAALAAFANKYSLYNLVSDANTTNLNILAGDQLTAQIGTGAIYTFTVGTAYNNTAAATPGNGGGSTLADLNNWLATGLGLNTTVTAGTVTVKSAASSLTLSGTLATQLGFNTTTAAAGNNIVTNAIDTQAYSNLAVASGSTLVTNLTDTTGEVLAAGASATAINTEAGTYLSLSVSGGQSVVVNISSATTVQNVIDQLNTVKGITASLDSSGNLKIVNSNATAATIGGTASGLIDSANAGTIAANGSLSNTLYQGYGSINPANIPTTDLVNLQAPTGQTRLVAGDQLNVSVGGSNTTISILGAAGVATSTAAVTVQDLMNALGQISGVSATLDATTGKLNITASGGSSISFTGTAANKLSLPATLAAGQSSVSGGGVSAAIISQYDTLRSQLDQLVQDSSYQGINLISSVNNNPLTVTFDEKATNAASLTINAVDDTSKGLGLTAATGAWKDSTTIAASLTALTDAQTTLRTQASTFGQNLTTVQTRQDFTNQMINTLKAGSDSLTLADMNTESANMLALQTRSQLGTQALSLANQANQSVLRLFG